MVSHGASSFGFLTPWLSPRPQTKALDSLIALASLQSAFVALDEVPTPYASLNRHNPLLSPWSCTHNNNTQPAPVSRSAADLFQAQKITNRRVNALEYVVIPRLEV